jgi:integrase
LFDEGRIKPYPFAKFEVGKNFEANREYLEPEELDKLQALYDSGKLTEIIKKAKSKHAQDFNIGVKYQQVLRYFLVACYCGLRHSDIKTLNKNDIKGDFIVKEMQKGRKERKKTVRIPLTKRLTELLDFKNPKGLLFENPVMETSQTNKYLRAIMREAGINKHITFHCSRHTFAVISLIKGIPIVVVSNILGHSELTTTQRYAKVVDRLKQEEMKKWDEALRSKQKIECKYCHNTLLETEFGAIAMKKVILVCNKCGKSGSHSLK